MARPERNNIDYFPFYCDEGKKMFYLEETYGNDGFATFLKILRELAKTDYHYLNLSKPTTMMFLSAKCKISKETLDSIIKDLVDLEKFDPVLWNENKIIWCQDFIDSIQDAYSKRKNKCITYEGLLVLLSSLGVRKPIKRDSLAPINTQSIVEYSKENKTIVKEEDETETKNKRKEEFDLFWDLYNKKRGRDKCLSKFKKLKDNEISLILDRVEDYVNSTPNVQYRKDPLTWLNGKHWNDEIENKKKSITYSANSF